MRRMSDFGLDAHVARGPLVALASAIGGGIASAFGAAAPAVVPAGAAAGAGTVGAAGSAAGGILGAAGSAAGGVAGAAGATGAAAGAAGTAAAGAGLGAGLGTGLEALGLAGTLATMFNRPKAPGIPQAPVAPNFASALGGGSNSSLSAQSPLAAAGGQAGAFPAPRGAGKTLLGQ